MQKLKKFKNYLAYGGVVVCKDTTPPQLSFSYKKKLKKII